MMNDLSIMNPVLIFLIEKGLEGPRVSFQRWWMYKNKKAEKENGNYNKTL
jgi:hypothetical protein